MEKREQHRQQQQQPNIHSNEIEYLGSINQKRLTSIE